jgi:hypothetical protein
MQRYAIKSVICGRLVNLAGNFDFFLQIKNNIVSDFTHPYPLLYKFRHAPSFYQFNTMSWMGIVFFCHCCVCFCSMRFRGAVVDGGFQPLLLSKVVVTVISVIIL